MPKIPRYQATKKLPSQGPAAQGDVGSAGAEWGEARHAGMALTQLGAQMAERMREAREVHEFSTAKTAAAKGFNQFELDIARDPDFAAHGEKFQKHARSLRSSALKGITEQNARDAFGRWYDEESERRGFIVQKLAERKEIEHMKAGLHENLEEAARQGDVRLIDELLAGAVAAGVIAADKAELKRMEAREKSEVYRASARIMDDPETAIAEINDKELYPNIDEKTRYELVRRAEIEMMRRERIAQQERVKRYDATDRDFLAKLGKDELTREEVITAIRQDRLSTQDGRFYLHKLEQEEPDGTDPDIYVQHRTDISEGAKEPHEIMGEIKESYALGFLTKQDFNALVGYIDTARARAKGGADNATIRDPYYKRAVDYLKSQIQPRRSLFMAESSEEARDLMDATLELDRRIAQAEADGKPFEGNALVELAYDIAPAFKASMAEQVKRRNERIKREGEELQAMREQEKAREEREENYRKLAVEVLRSKGLLVNEETIQTITDQIKALEQEEGGL